jgi:hypothetical protein
MLPRSRERRLHKTQTAGRHPKIMVRILAHAKWHTISWRTGTGKLKARFAAVSRASRRQTTAADQEQGVAVVY